MRRRAVILVAGALLFDLIVGHGVVSAAGADSTTDGTTASGGDRPRVDAYSGPIMGVGGGGGGSVCRWERLFYDREPDQDFDVGEVPVSPHGSGTLATRDIAGREHTMFRMTCPDGSQQDRWVPTGVTVADLIPAIRAHAEGMIELPVPQISPPASSGGIVNLGLWLAVEEQTLPPLSAEAGTAWITLSPRLVSTRYDFGNGDSVSCDGVGVPIEDVHPDLDVVEQSPLCGYTYRRSSPDDDPFQLTVTTVWELPYQSSSGSGSLPPIERSLTFAYDVDEIQTLGTRN